MDGKKLIALLPEITSEVVDFISSRDEMTEDEAIRNLYSSKLYQDLENEETKVWQFSTETLYSLYIQEKKTGKIEYPEC
ncbi:MAG: hypothetical protein IJ733_11160 [Lachnospiraceae bacterium]|nr:hypothetical protein [Lachnospiraceae bacterium]